MFAWVLALILLAAPVGALAADGASLLGPAATSPGATGAAETQSSGLLQPANTSDGATTQPANAAAGGVGQSAAQTLQQPANQDQAKLFIQGDVDNSKASSGNALSAGIIYVLILLAVVAGVTAALMWRQRQKAGVYSEATDKSEPQVIAMSADEPSAPAPLTPKAKPAKKRKSKKGRSRR